MADLTDEQFLGYVELHSETPRHAFSREDAYRLMDLAGVETMTVDDPALGQGFVGISAGEAYRLTAMARKIKRP